MLFCITEGTRMEEQRSPANEGMIRKIMIRYHSDRLQQTAENLQRTPQSLIKIIVIWCRTTNLQPVTAEIAFRNKIAAFTAIVKQSYNNKCSFTDYVF